MQNCREASSNVPPGTIYCLLSQISPLRVAQIRTILYQVVPTVKLISPYKCERRESARPYTRVVAQDRQFLLHNSEKLITNRRSLFLTFLNAERGRQKSPSIVLLLYSLYLLAATRRPHTIW